MINKSTETSAADLELMEQIAQWILILDSDECTTEDREKFLLWQQQSPRHSELFEQMQSTFGQFSQLRKNHQQPIPYELIEQTVKQTSENQLFSKQKLYSFALIAAMASLLWLTVPTDEWLADSRHNYQTWTEQTLPDYSDIKISGKTSFDIDFDQKERVIKLINGNILVDVAKDAQRPFYVKTDHANIKALGTRFIVHHFEHATLLTMLHSSTQVETTLANGQIQTAYVHAGEQILIDQSGLHPVQKISINLFEDSWNRKMLVIDLMPLDQVLGILQNYEQKKIKYDAAQLHQIKVSAILPLNGKGTDLLQASLPITVKENLFGQKVIEMKK